MQKKERERKQKGERRVNNVRRVRNRIFIFGIRDYSGFNCAVNCIHLQYNKYTGTDSKGWTPNC